MTRESFSSSLHCIAECKQVNGQEMNLKEKSTELDIMEHCGEGT
jgi:hypothetical protein